MSSPHQGSGGREPDAEPPADVEIRRFVGRDRQLGALVAALRDAPQPPGPVRLLTGPAGIGKTRLARELSSTARAQGFTVCWAYCGDEAVAPPYWPWIQVVRELRGRGGALTLGEHVLDDPAGAERIELFDAVAQLLREHAARRPLLVVLDDLHRADEPSLLLARFVARHLQDQPLLLVGTVRASAAARHEEHLDALRRFGREVPLAGLDVAEVAALVGDAGRAAQVHAVTDGNPLFVEQVLHADEHPSARPTRADGPAPDALARAVAARLDALAPAARAVVEAAAVLGARHDRTVLAALLEVEDAALATHTAGILHETEDGAGAFGHPLLAEIAYQRIPPATRRALHRRAAALVPADHLEERAHHLLLAGPDARTEAVTACRAAADAATAALAHEDAAGHHRRALAALGDDPGFASERIELQLELAGALWRSGLLEEAENEAEGAWLLAESSGDPALLARAAMRIGLDYHFVPGPPSPWPDRVRRALAAQPSGDSPGAVRLLATTATGCVSAGDLAQARAVAADAVAMARRLDDPAALGSALLAELVADLGPATLNRRIAGAHEILACAAESGDYRLTLHGRFMLMAALVERGDLRAVRAEYANQRAASEELGEPRFSRFATWFRCLQAMLDGDATLAEELAEASYAVSEQIRDPDAVALYGGQLGVIRWMQGRIDEMEPLYRACQEAEPYEPLWPAALAWVHADQGRTAEAAAALAAVADLSAVPSGVSWLITVTAFAEAAAVAGTDAQVAAAWSELLPYADRMVPIGMGAATWGPVARALGRVALRLGRVDEGVELLAAAVDLCARLRARPWLVDAQLWLAEALLDHRPDDPRLDALLDEAAAGAAALDLPPFARRAEGLRARRTADRRGRPAPSPVVRIVEAAPAPRVSVMGAFEVVAADGTVARWRSRKARELLKYLVSRRGAPVSREVLMDVLWPGDAPTVLGNRLSVALSTVRRALDPGRRLDPRDLLAATVDTVQLRLDVVEVDVEHFLDGGRGALALRAVDPDGAAQRARALLDRHRGEALPDEPHAEWAVALRDEVRAMTVALARVVADSARQRGQLTVAADAHRRVLDVDPYDEQAHQGLIEAFDAVGAHGQAEAARARYRSMMAELGVRPTERWSRAAPAGPHPSAAG